MQLCLIGFVRLLSALSGCISVYIFFFPPSCQSIIDLDGPVGMVLTADRNTREPAITQTQPAHYPRAHDNSCLVPAQGQGCSCTRYVMKRRRRGGEQLREGFYWDVSQCIIVRIDCLRLALGGAFFWHTQAFECGFQAGHPGGPKVWVKKCVACWVWV